MLPEKTQNNPKKCPLCGADNSCDLEKGRGTCWCFGLEISLRDLEQSPGWTKDACLCMKCATQGKAETSSLSQREALQRIKKDR